MLNLSEQELQRLYRLAQDKNAIEALKKFFLNHFIDVSGDVQTNAASYLALTFLETAFKSLNNLQPKESSPTETKNVV